MEQYLTVNNLWGVIDGTDTEPTDATDKPKFLQRCQLACTHIALHVSPSWLSAIHIENDPKNIWDGLKHLNCPGGFSTCMALCHKFPRMKRGPKIPMSMWITSVHDV